MSNAIQRQLSHAILSALMLTAACHISAENKFIDALPFSSAHVTGFSASALMNDMAEMPLHHIEGIWQFPSTGVSIAILRDTSAGNSRDAAVRYNIILLHSPNRSLKPGTTMGMATPSARHDTYDARIYTRAVGSRLSIPKKFTITLDFDNSALLFRRNKSAFGINLWRLLPYLWRHSVYRNRQEPPADGCVRIYPEPLYPREPVYL